MNEKYDQGREARADSFYDDLRTELRSRLNDEDNALADLKDEIREYERATADHYEAISEIRSGNASPENVDEYTVSPHEDELVESDWVTESETEIKDNCDTECWRIIIRHLSVLPAEAWNDDSFFAKGVEVIAKYDRSNLLPAKLVELPHVFVKRLFEKQSFEKLASRALEFLPSSYRSDLKFVRAAVIENGRALHFASRELRSNREIVLKVVENDGSALKFASPILREDPRVAITAVKDNGSALQFVSNELRSNREIVRKAVENDGSAIKYASKKLREDPEFARFATQTECDDDLPF